MCFCVTLRHHTLYTTREMGIVAAVSHGAKRALKILATIIRMRETRERPPRRPFEKHRGRMLALKVMLLHIGEKGSGVNSLFISGWSQPLDIKRVWLHSTG